MTCLVDGDGALFGLCHHLGLLLKTADDTVDGIEEVLLLYRLRVMAGSNQGSLITNVGNICTREAWCLACEEVDIHAIVSLHGLQMHLEYLLTLIEVRQVNVDLTIETACTQQGGVEHVSAVGGCKDDYTRVGAEAVHLCKQGIQGVLALIVTSHSRILGTGTAYGIDLVDEDDAWTLLLGLLEKVTHSRGTDAHEHLHEVGTRHREEWYTSLSGYSLGQ